VTGRRKLYALLAGLTYLLGLAILSIRWHLSDAAIDSLAMAGAMMLGGFVVGNGAEHAMSAIGTRAARPPTATTTTLETHSEAPIL